MADDEYQPTSDHDFSCEEEDRRLTRVIHPDNKVTSQFCQSSPDIALTVDEIADSLQSVSMFEDSDDEGEQLKDCHYELFAGQKEDAEDQPVKKTSAKKENKSKVAIVKPNSNTNVEKMPSDNTKQQKTRARTEKKVLANDEEEFPSEDCPSTSGKQNFHSLELTSASCSVFSQVKAQPSLESHSFIQSIDTDQLLAKSNGCSENEYNRAKTVVDTKPARAQTKKVTKGTAKTNIVKTEKLILEKCKDDIEVKQEEIGKKGRRGKIATAVVPNTSESTDKQETVVKMDQKLKSSRKVAKGKVGVHETLEVKELPVEINKTKNNKHVEKVVSNSSDSNSGKRGKKPPEKTNKESENDETSSDSTKNDKPSRNRRLPNLNEPNSAKENKTTVKKIRRNKKDLDKNEMDINELTVDDNIVVSPLPAKRKQKNLRKEVNELKDEQPLKELNTAQEVKPAPRKRNIKNRPQAGDIQIENDPTTNVPETKLVPKKRNMNNATQIDTVEMEPAEKINSLRPKNVRSNAKENLNDKEEKQTSKPRRGANKMQEMAASKETSPEETAPRRTTRKIK